MIKVLFVGMVTYLLVCAFLFRKSIIASIKSLLGRSTLEDLKSEKEKLKEAIGIKEERKALNDEIDELNDKLNKDD